MKDEYKLIKINCDEFEVVKKDGSFYNVDLAIPYCNCKGFFAHKHCIHLTLCRNLKEVKE